MTSSADSAATARRRWKRAKPATAFSWTPTAPTTSRQAGSSTLRRRSSSRGTAMCADGRWRTRFAVLCVSGSSQAPPVGGPRRGRANHGDGRSHAWLPRGTELVGPRPMNWGEVQQGGQRHTGTGVPLDECLPRRLKRDLVGHHVRTGPEIGWASKANGELLALAAVDSDVFLTSDRNISHQQNRSAFDIAVIVLVAPAGRPRGGTGISPRRHGWPGRRFQVAAL